MTTTLYLTDQPAPGSQHGALQVGGTAPSSAVSTIHWVVGTLSLPHYARMMVGNATPATGDFGTGAQPSGVPVNSPYGSAFRTGRYRGSVASGTWTLAVPVLAVGAGGSQDGRVRVRIWKGSDPAGSNATEVTSTVAVGSALTNLGTVTPQVSSLSVSLPATSLNGEYLFFDLAWEVTGSGASAPCDVWIYLGATAMITTPTLPAEIPGFYAVFYETANFLVPDPDDANDLTNRLMAYQSKRGRADALSGIQAGTLSCLLDNDDAALDPENAGSIYAPNVKLKRGLQVVASYGGITYARGTVAIDSIQAIPLPLGANAQIAGQDLYNRIIKTLSTVTFAAETESVRFANIMTEIGVTGDIVADDAFSPPAASLVKTNILEHVDLLIKAGRGQFWIQADGTPAYWGRHERINQPSVGSFGAGGDYPIPTPDPILDDAGLYNQVNVTRTASGVNEVQRITVTGTPTAISFHVNFDGGVSTLYGTSGPAVRLLSSIQYALDTTPTIGPGNTIVTGGPWPGTPVDIEFVGKFAKLTVPAITLTDVTFAGGSSPSIAVSTIISGVSATQTVDDVASQADYGVIPFDLEAAAADLLASDADGLSWAQWFAYQQSQPTSRFRAIRIDPWVDPANLWPIWLAADMGTVIEVTHDVPGTKGMVAERYYVEGIEESVTLEGTPDGSFVWLVSKAEEAQGHFWSLDDSTNLGVDTWLAY